MDIPFKSEKPINLTKRELIDITMKKRKKSQLNALLMMGIPCCSRPDGSPLVSRLAFEQAMGATTSLTRSNKSQPEFGSLKDA